MRKKTERALKPNWTILGKLVLTALFWIICWQAIATQDSLSDSEAVEMTPDSAEVIYHGPWTFEEGFADDYLGQKDFDYSEAKENETWLQRIKRQIQNAWDNFWISVWDNNASTKFWQVFTQLAPYLLLGLLMALLVWLALKYTYHPDPSAKTYLHQPTTDELLLKSDNLKALAEDSLRRQDFRLALRYRYLMVLQLLIRRDLIVWKSSKTNFDYQKELSNSPYLGPFTEVTRIYNFVWYGHFDLDEATYSELKNAFDHLDHLS